MKLMRFAFALAAPLLLASCLLSPGKFTSGMVVNSDGSFSFTYDGEIFVLGMSKLMDMAAASDAGEFEPSCYDEENYEDRECSEEEIAEQRSEWEANADERHSKASENEELMKMMMGGIDPGSPEAAAELVQRLERQKGFQSVVNKGDGVFEVKYAVSGRFSHGFSFPLIEGMRGVQPFVVATPRSDGGVRIEAPGFAAQPDGGAGGMGAMPGLASLAMMGKIAEAGAEGKGSEGEMPPFPVPDGVFTVRTDGEILTNNTEEGPTSESGMRVLHWNISSRTSKAPETLIRLAN